jgi:putative ABC transport system permease protein
MLKHALISALKGIKKNKVNLIINIIGMTFGIGAVMVISAYVIAENDIGKELNNKNIYRIELESKIGHLPYHNYATAGYLIQNSSLVKNACMFRKDDAKLSYNKESFDLKNIIFSDSSFFDIYDVSIIKGNLLSFKNTPNSIVISQSLAKKIFGNLNPIGKTILTPDLATVVAIFKDIPEINLNEFNAVVNISSSISKEDRNRWNNFGFVCLVQLEKDASPNDIAIFLDEKIKKMNPYVINELSFKTKLVDYTNIYFSPPVLYEPFKQGNKMFIVFFISIAAFLLVIAIINSINLTKTQWFIRIKEICIRRSNGASQLSLLLQFVGETIILNIISFILAISIIIFIIPQINEISDILRYLIEPKFILTMFFCYITIGIITGLIANIKLSDKGLIKGLKGERFNNTKSYSPQMTLITFQFIVCITIIASIIGVNKQINFVLGKDIGFKKENLVQFPISNFNKYEALRNELLKHPQIAKVSYTNATVESKLSRQTFELINNGKKKAETFPMFSADLHFSDLMGFKLVQGRGFEQNDKNNTCLINEATAKTYSINDISKGVFINNKKVVGVIKNYNFASLHQNIEPLVIFGGETPLNKYGYFEQCVVKINSSDYATIKTTLNIIKESWKQISGNDYADVQFLDDVINRMYIKEVNFQKILILFTFLIALIATMGLFGVSLNIITKKYKEIGIRKVHGASVLSVLKMLNMTFIKWIFLALIISIPIAFFIIDKWLENFAFRTPISWWIFGFTGIIVFGITILTISWQTWIAANMNPVKSLKYE